MAETTSDTSPTSAQLWHALRTLYGSRSPADWLLVVLAALAALDLGGADAV